MTASSVSSDSAMAAIFERKIITRDALVDAAPFAERAGRVHQRRLRHPASRARDLSRRCESARRDCLIVGVNSDASVRMLGKGDDRPINQRRRPHGVAGGAGKRRLRGVLRARRRRVELISALRPDVLVKGGDYDMDALPESALVRGWGGKALAIRVRARSLDHRAAEEGSYAGLKRAADVRGAMSSCRGLGREA